MRLPWYLVLGWREEKEDEEEGRCKVASRAKSASAYLNYDGWRILVTWMMVKMQLMNKTMVPGLSDICHRY